MSLCTYQMYLGQSFTLATCSSGLTTNTYGPMNSVTATDSKNRIAFIIPASQLATIANGTITSTYFKRLSSSGSLNSTTNFKIYLKNVTVTDFGAADLDWASEIGTATPVYDSNPDTAVGSTSGYKKFLHSTNFVYTLGSNLAVYLEYSQTAGQAAAIAWDYEYGASCVNSSNNNTTKYVLTTAAFGPTLTNSNYRRPVIAFDATVPPPTTVPPCTTVSSPANAATGVSVTPTFTWVASPITSSYSISLGTTPGGTNVINNVDVGNVTTYSVPSASPLAYSTQYYLTVIPKNGIGSATGCNASTFTTTTIPCPTVSAPASAAANVSITPTITWSAVNQATGYKLRIGTSAGASDVMNDFDMGNVTSYTLTTPLNNGTVYYYTVKAYTATSLSASCTERSFSTVCVSTTVPYAQNFDTTATGSSSNINAPICWSFVKTAGSAGYGYVSSTGPSSSPNSYYLYNSSDNSGNIMLVSPQTTNLADGTRRVRFMAKGGSAGYTLQIGTLNSTSNPASFTAIGSSIALTNSWVSYIVNIPAGADQYLAFKHGLGGTSRGVYIDDVFVESIPTCIEPTGLTVGTITPNSANLSWTASTTPPASGYDVYYTTSNTAPAMTAVPNITGVSGLSTPLSPLTPATTYYVWVRSHCSGTDISVWSIGATFRTLCQPPAILSANGAAVCGASGSATITATADAGATITWYDAATGGTVLGAGPSYTTPVITTNTTYYVSAKSNGAVTTVGPASPSVLGSISSSNYDIGTYYQIFDVTSPVVLTSIDVFPTSTVAIGTNSAIEIRDNSGATLISVPYTVSVNDGTTPQTVNLNYALPVGTGYRIGQGLGAAVNLNRNTAGATYPFTSSSINVTGNNFSSGPNYWYYIYNWKFSGVCESARQPVTVTVNASCLGTSEVSTKETVKLYPNPFTSTLNISDVAKVQSISIVDLAGRIVKTIETPSSVLHLEDLKEGMYLVTLHMKDGSQQTIKAMKK